jgi:ribosome-associated heat shock protein Hsp15
VRREADEKENDERTRLDKWLWAARFFKTRALAADAIESGKIEVNDDRPKRGRAVHLGDRLRIRLGPYEHLLVVRALSSRRGPASVAKELYEETAESIANRERTAERLRSAPPPVFYEGGRPTKKDRRAFERLRGGDE